ncbi:hypothetical protein IC582_029749 [Cucumis melo]
MSNRDTREVEHNSCIRKFTFVYLESCRQKIQSLLHNDVFFLKATKEIEESTSCYHRRLISKMGTSSMLIKLIVDLKFRLKLKF